MAVTAPREMDEVSLAEPPARAPSHYDRRSRWLERLAEGAVKAVALVSIVSVFLILVFVGKEALPVLTSEAVRHEIAPSAFVMPHVPGGFMWQPTSDDPKYNVLPLFAGTLKVSLLALLFALPMSVLAALYVADFAGRRAREIVKPAIELLAGIPSVVVGFFALVVLSTWVQRAFGTEHRLNALVAGLGLSFAVCPIVFSISEDALRAVPTSYRAASLALGATRSQTLLRIVLPAAMPGIAAAVVLGFGRAVGETMIVLLASGNAALLDWSVGRSTRTVTATIAQELGEVVVGSAHYHVLFALGALLFLGTLVVNIVGARVVDRMRGVGGPR
jgi:phosphate transport system permease protein